MAAGAGAASGGSLESTLERRFQGVSNTMDSIQGLSTWCIDNKKYHSLIVRHWMKCLRRSDTSHRLNLFYVANDVIQNCKRKNAIVYRTAFAEMLPDAFVLVNNEGDSKVIKSVERILTIWEERGVYSGTLITELRSSLVKEESPPETPVEQKTPVESKADLTSKIVAEFVPQALFDELSKYKRSLEELDQREKQLAAMRVDICSSDALKRLKDKAGGKKFSKDFEEGSAQLQEFVKFFDKQIKTGPPLMQALSNADIFYEMQYKEVKIVANAYQTFANRVSHLKRKLDSLKNNLPDLDDSPIPSPSADAPSPTGSESPFHGLDLAGPDPDIDGCAMDDEAEPPAPSPLSSPGGSPKHAETLGQSDNREVEDMDLSEEEMDSIGIIVEEQIERSTHPKVSTSKMEPSVATEQPVAQVTPPAAAPVKAPVAAPVKTPVKAPAAAPVKAPVAAPVKTPVKAPAAAPVKAPVKAPIVAPVKAPIAAPVKAPVAAPVKALVKAPVKAPQWAPVGAPVKAPVAAPVGAPVKAPLWTPVKAPVKAPVWTPVKAPVKAPVAAPVKAPVWAPVGAPVAAPVAAPVKAPVAAPVKAPVAAPVKAPVAAPVKAPVWAPVVAPVAAPVKAPVAAPVKAPVAVPAAAMESVDMAKIGSILSSLNSVMKNTGPLVESPPAAAATAGFSLRTKPAASVACQDASSLVNLLSKVDMSPADLIGALSKVKGQGSRDGIASRLSSPATNVSSDSSSTGKIPPSSTSTSAAPSQSPSLSSVAPMPSSHSSTLRHSTSSQAPPQKSNPASALVQALHRDMDLITEPEPSPSSQSLESKIHSFLQGNPAFNAFGMDLPTNPAPGGDNLSPVTGTDNQGGTPVRDEGGGTPTQDEIMDKHVVVPFTSNANQSSIGETVKTAPVAYQDGSQQNRNNLQHHLQPGAAQNGQVYRPYPYGQHKMPEHAITAPGAHYQQISAQTGGPVPGERAPGSASSAQTIEDFHGVSERGWYGDTYPEGNPQQPRGYNVTVPGGAGENKTSGLYPYQTEKFQEPQASQHGATTSPGFLRGTLPPVPKFPPPPRVFDAPPRVFDAPPRAFDGPPPATSSMMMPPGQQPSAGPGEVIGPRGDSVISGMVVHDHQHKSMFHPDDSPYDRDRPRPPHPEDFHPHPDDQMHYQDELHHRDACFFQDDPYRQPDDPYYRPGSPPHHYPRVQGRLTPPHSPSEDPYYAHDYRRHSPPSSHYTPRRPPPPPHFEMRHPGPRPPHRPPHPAQHPHPRGPPRAPFPRFQGPDPGLRGKRPGPRGGGHPGPMFPPKRPFPPPRY